MAMNVPDVFDLSQLIRDPRSGDLRQHHFDTYATLAEAKAAARKELKGSKWVIFKTSLVASSDK